MRMPANAAMRTQGSLSSPLDENDGGGEKELLDTEHADDDEDDADDADADDDAEHEDEDDDAQGLSLCCVLRLRPAT